MTISKRLHFIVATLITVVLLVIVGGGVVWFSRVQLTQKVIERYLTQEGIVALQIAETAKDDVETSHSFLSALGSLSGIYAGDSDTCNAELKDAIPFIPRHINRISRFDSKGIVTCSTDQRLVGLNYTIFDPAIKEILADPDHRPTIGELVIPPGEEEYTIGFYEPIRDANGAFVGALKAGTKISTIRERYEQNPAFGYVGEPILLDDDGGVLYSTNADILSLNVFEDEVGTDSYDKNTLQQILSNSSRYKVGTLRYEMDGQVFAAVHERIDILPGHSWTFILAIATDSIQSALFPDAYRLIKAIMLGNIIFVIITLLLFMLYVTRNLIRREAVISPQHDEHMQKDLSEIDEAFGKVTEKLGKLEAHLANDMNALHEEADKKIQDESGKKA